MPPTGWQRTRDIAPAIIDVQSNHTWNVTMKNAERVMLESGATLTVTGNLTNADANINYVTANGTIMSLAYADVSGGSLAFRSVPTAAMAAGDRYEAEVSARHTRQLSGMMRHSA